MKKNDLVKFAVAGVFSCLCISGQAAREADPEMPMTKSSKSSDDAQTIEQSAPPAPDQQQTAKNMSSKSRGAAKRVVEGVSSDASVEKYRGKSAAQIAIETEIELNNN